MEFVLSLLSHRKVGGFLVDFSNHLILLRSLFHKGMLTNQQTNQPTDRQLDVQSCSGQLKIVNTIHYVFFSKKYIFVVGNFEGETISQAPEVLVQACNPAKIAARWRCGLPIKNLRSHYNGQLFVSFNFGILSGTSQTSINVFKCGRNIILFFSTNYCRDFLYVGGLVNISVC